MKYVVSGKPSDGPVSRYLNRPISTRITRLILRITTKVTPNQVTVVTFILGVFAGLLYLITNPIIAGVMVQISSIIDGVDGEIARALKKESKYGAFIDSICDRIVDASIIIGISIYILRNAKVPVEILFLVSLLALFGSVLVSYVRAKTSQLLGSDIVAIERVNMATRDVRLFIIFVGSVLGFLFETLVILAIITYVQVILKVITAGRLYKTASAAQDVEIITQTNEAEVAEVLKSEISVFPYTLYVIT